MKTAPEWDDWRWQLEQARRGAELVGPDVALAPTDFPFAVTPYYWSLVDPGDPGDPIRRMIVPTADELHPSHVLREDPIEEERHAVLPGLIRR